MLNNNIPKQPSIKNLLIPTIRAIQSLGGEASNSEIATKVIELESISAELAEVLHNVGPKTILEYRLAWARSCLKKYGAIENSGKGRWRLTARANEITQKNLNVVYRSLHSENENPLDLGIN